MLGWILAIIMIIAAVFLFFGKGTWIVAGLNVLTEAEKKKINVKKHVENVELYYLLVHWFLLFS